MHLSVRNELNFSISDRNVSAFHTNNGSRDNSPEMQFHAHSHLSFPESLGTSHLVHLHKECGIHIMLA